MVLTPKTLAAILGSGFGTGLIVCLILRGMTIPSPAGDGRHTRNFRLLVEAAHSPGGPLWFALGAAVLGLVIVIGMAIKAVRE